MFRLEINEAPVMFLLSFCAGGSSNERVLTCDVVIEVSLRVDDGLAASDGLSRLGGAFLDGQSHPREVARKLIFKIVEKLITKYLL